MAFQVVGRHAMLFDDDSTADFVNSSQALVEWYSLQIDRHDVRHLLSAPPPPHRRSRKPVHLSPKEPALEAQFDHERYLDLPSHSAQPVVSVKSNQMAEAIMLLASLIGRSEYSTDPKEADAGIEFSGFFPPFPFQERFSILFQRQMAGVLLVRMT